MYCIENNRLVGVPYYLTPNTDRSRIAPQVLVIHYTAGGEDSVATLSDSRSRVSAHVVVTREGAVLQLVPFDQKAWHAGASMWRGRKNLNGWSIGIELENWGWLHRNGNGRFVSWSGAEVPEPRIHRGRHKHGGPHDAWEIFPAPQIAAAVHVAVAICATYHITDIVGHDDIAPGRKVDPGPAWPMTSFRGMVLEPKADTEPIRVL